MMFGIMHYGLEMQLADEQLQYSKLAPQEMQIVFMF
jgi:hypothetical protein